MSIAIIHHADCLLHENGSPTHPEQPARLSAIEQALSASDLRSSLQFIDAPLAQKQDLYRVHDIDYVDHVFQVAPKAGRVMLDADTSMNPHTLNAALRAAGSALKAVDCVMSGSYETVFCSVRPPGHHAGKAQAAGFCVFNNIAVGAAYALAKHGLKRIAILDFDVHHGNGTEDIFAGDERILFGSSFQHPYYPYSGEAPAADNIMNLPMPAGIPAKQWRAEVEQAWFARLDAFKPELVMISAGFDGHADDAMGGFQLRETDYAWFMGKMQALAARHTKGRVISCLEGGYDLPSLGRSAVAHLERQVV